MAVAEKSVEVSNATEAELLGSIPFSIVMKIGGSSVASAERMREVSDLILAFPHERPIIVLSAMGKTTNHLLQVCTAIRLDLLFCFVFCMLFLLFVKVNVKCVSIYGFESSSFRDCQDLC